MREEAACGEQLPGKSGGFRYLPTCASGAPAETQLETTLNGKFKTDPRMPLAASLRSRLDNTPSRADRYRRLAPITARSLVRFCFSTQATEHPGITGSTGKAGSA